MSLLIRQDIALIERALEALDPRTIDDAADIARILEGLSEIRYWKSNWTSRSLSFYEMRKNYVIQERIKWLHKITARMVLELEPEEEE